MTDSELTLLVVQSGGSVRMTITPGKDNEEVYSFPSTAALWNFVEKIQERDDVRT
jgi:hypothetical protein